MGYSLPQCFFFVYVCVCVCVCMYELVPPGKTAKFPYIKCVMGLENKKRRIDFVSHELRGCQNWDLNSVAWGAGLTCTGI